MVVKIGIVKIGNIGTSPIIDLVLDERADRNDVDVRTIGAGAKMGKTQVDDILPKIKAFNPDLMIFISPNPNAEQPKRAREILSKTEIPTIIIGDGPGEKAIYEMTQQQLGYILIRADPMIGARREFLDATEMALFNAYVLKVLSVTGAFRLVQETIDDLINKLNNHEEIKLPEIVVTAELAVSYAGFQNPYALSKALAAYNIASHVSEVDVRACFRTEEAHIYIPLVTAAHEMMQAAARLAEEAREIEKSNDTVLRTPHTKDGALLRKTSLMDNFD